ncbi:nitrous oxide reductase accessory protein NosL [Thalassotalea insulae]|uniref:Nitrous oxide reductase accessory protein NosL n=1 Tax=Thalassotalea insulae TaxID=2056778 RepID=A0ABQ6GQ16_9GAMM|nr:nitrous oxide reductase accessory protein NosL [Thalassotalea insulae]GLX77981.1 nitrous oxide reductase accessory protein NosL [Thalassotalea insulae]
MKILTTFPLFILCLLVACSQPDENKHQQQQSVAIESNDECHLCGMLIANFSGPKAELYRQGITEKESNKIHKFCSTRDMFSFYLDPENKRNVTSIYVHDMSKSPWDEPNDSYFIDAKTAWFVAGSDKTGAMGPTLASFAKQQDAQQFAQQFGGQVLAFEQVDLAVLME